LAASANADVIKIVVYMPSPMLPDDCRRVRFHLSRSAGFIHIVDARDYLEIARTLRVPEEVVRYFKYREAILTGFDGACATLPEASIAGHFVGGKEDEQPSVDSAAYLRRLIQDEEEWNLAPLLRGLHDHLSEPTVSDDYYSILLEFAKLPRSAWRIVKQRILRCIENVRKNEFAKPYRIVTPQTGCGFVFVPAPAELATRLDWQTIRTQALLNFALAHKYDQRLAKCIGVQIARIDDDFDLAWCFIAHEWVEDVALQRALDENFPFRPVKEGVAYGYRLVGD
jgi:hypothetical protein